MSSSKFVLVKTHRLQAVAGLTKDGQPAQNVMGQAYTRVRSAECDAALALPDLVLPSERRKLMTPKEK